MKVTSQVSRLWGKTQRFLSRHIPYNMQYRPIGIKSLFPNELASITFQALRPPYTSRLDLDSKFVNDCSSYCKPIMAYDTDGDFVATLRNGRVYSVNAANTAIISEENYFIEELSFQWITTHQPGAEHNQVFRLKTFRKPKRIKGTVLSMLGGGGAKTYYYHWLIDCIAKLGLLEETGQLDKVDYFLIPSYKLPYHKEYLDHFGITPEKIIVEDENPHIQADYLIATSFVQKNFHTPQWAIDFLYKSFAPKNQNAKRDKLIYIPRGDAAVNRKVLNEGELIEALSRYGVETHYLAEMAVPDEVELFRSARLIIGAQGSGFANLVYCQPGTKVLVFFPDAHVRHIEYDLCNKKQLEFHYIICPSDRVVDNTWEAHFANVTADIPAILDKIHEILDFPIGGYPFIMVR